MLSLRTVAVAAAIAGCALISASCESVISPCEKQEAPSVARSASGNLIEGTWALATVNGSPVPEPGFQVAPGQFIRAGILHFHTDRLSGSCDVARTSAGNVIVQYVLVDGAGVARPGLSASGGFEYIADSDVVRVEAFGREVSGTATASRLVISNLAPERFPDLQLEFRR